jgi:hypothetical protein
MFFFIQGGLNIRNTNTEAENYTRLYINVFICKIYNMGQGKQAPNSVFERHMFYDVITVMKIQS